MLRQVATTSTSEMEGICLKRTHSFLELQPDHTLPPSSVSLHLSPFSRQSLLRDSSPLFQSVTQTATISFLGTPTPSCLSATSPRLTPLSRVFSQSETHGGPKPTEDFSMALSPTPSQYGRPLELVEGPSLSNVLRPMLMMVSST